MPLPGVLRGRRAAAHRTLDGCSGRAGSAETRAGQLRGGGREASRSGAAARPGRRLGERGVSPGQPSRHADVGKPGARRAAPHRGARRAPGGNTPPDADRRLKPRGCFFRLEGSVPRASHPPLPTPPAHLPFLLPLSLLLSPLLPKEDHSLRCRGEGAPSSCLLPSCRGLLPRFRRRPSGLSPRGIYHRSEGLGPKRRFHQLPRSRFLCSWGS